MVVVVSYLKDFLSFHDACSVVWVVRHHEQAAENFTHGDPEALGVFAQEDRVGEKVEDGRDLPVAAGRACVMARKC